MGEKRNLPGTYVASRRGRFRQPAGRLWRERDRRFVGRLGTYESSATVRKTSSQSWSSGCASPTFPFQTRRYVSCHGRGRAALSSTVGKLSGIDHHERAAG